MKQLSRIGTRRGQLGCGFAIGVLLMGLGGGAVYMQKTHPDPDPKDDTGVFVVGYAFAIVGALMTLAGLQQLLALRTPQTILMLDGDALERGSVAVLRIIQPGPVRLYSIRANLVGEGTERVSRLEEGVSKSIETTRSLGTFNFFEAKDVTVLAGEQWQAEVRLQVPDAAPTARDGDSSVDWRIEVWGRVKRGADFMHPFAISVVRQPAR